MSGSAGSRGYLLQTLAAVFEVLERDDLDKIALEPDSVSEKVDILCSLIDGRKRGIQVKSSKNTINKPDAEKWADELKNSLEAEENQLQLIGRCSDGVPDSHSGVDIVKIGFFEVASHRLRAGDAFDRRLDSMGASPLPLVVRQLIVDRLSIDLFSGATISKTFSKDSFNELITSTLLKIYPDAIISRESELAKLESDLRKYEEIDRKRYQTKFEACSDALKLIDSWLSYVFQRSVVPSPKIQKGTTEDLRDCHNRLILSIEDTRILDLFIWIFHLPEEVRDEENKLDDFKNFKSEDQRLYYQTLEEQLERKPSVTDLLNEFRNLVREELAFGEPLRLNEELAWMSRFPPDDV